MDVYIKQGRFGEFVTNIVQIEQDRRNKEAEKEDDNKLWTAYLLGGAKGQTFTEWKAGLTQKQEPESYAMTDEQVEAEKQHAKGILKKISPV